MPTTGCSRAGGSPRAASTASAAAPTSARCSTGVGAYPAADGPDDLDRARHGTPRSRRRAAADRPAAAQPRGAPPAARAAAAARCVARHRRRAPHAPAPRPPRPALAPPGRAGRADRRPARRRAPAVAARIRRRARGRAGRGDRDRIAERRRRRRRAITAGAASSARTGPRSAISWPARAASTTRATPTSSTACARSAQTASTSRSCRSGAGRSRLGPGHLDPLRAAQALVLLAPRVAVPIHWGTYAVGPAARGRRRYLRAPLAAVPGGGARRSLRPCGSCALEPGESLELDVSRRRPGRRDAGRRARVGRRQRAHRAPPASARHPRPRPCRRSRACAGSPRSRRALWAGTSARGRRPRSSRSAARRRRAGTVDVQHAVDADLGTGPEARARKQRRPGRDERLVLDLGAVDVRVRADEDAVAEPHGWPRGRAARRSP